MPTVLGGRCRRRRPQWGAGGRSSTTSPSRLRRRSDPTPRTADPSAPGSAAPSITARSGSGKPRTGAAPQRPQTLAERHVLESLLGTGGYAQVWRAYDLRLHRHVAVKVPKPGRTLTVIQIDGVLTETHQIARLGERGDRAEKQEPPCWRFGGWWGITEVGSRSRSHQLAFPAMLRRGWFAVPTS